MDCKTALLTLLDQVDYTIGNCRLNEPVGGVLPVEIIELCREAIQTSNIVTCVYCGMAYPEGTPPHGSKVLTDHIKVCEKHPMREAEAKIAKLYKALANLVGASSKEELVEVGAFLRSMLGIERDKIAVINAIHVLLETAEAD